MSGNAHSPSFLPNNVNFNSPIAYNGSPVIKGNLRSDPSLNENDKGNYGQFDHMRHVMGRSYPTEMWPSQSMRYGISSNFKGDFTAHGYNFPKLVQDEFMGQGYQQGFKMPCNEFLPYPPSHSQMMLTSQSLPPLTRIPTDGRHSSSEMLPTNQGSFDKFMPENRLSAMSPPQFYLKPPKCGDQIIGKKSQENLSSEDMSTDSDVGGGNLSRAAGTSRSSSPANRGMHPTPPSTGCSNSRPSTPSQSAGLMPPPLNPNQNRVFSPVAMNNSGFYSPHFQMGGFNRPGGPLEHPQFGGFSYPLQPPTLMRSNQHSYRMREPHFADIRHYQSQARTMDSRFDNDPEYLRHAYRHNIMPTRVPPPASMYGHMGDFQARAPPYESYNSSHDPSIPSSIQHRKLPGDLDFEKSAFERNYLQKHGHFPQRMPSPSPFSALTSSKSPQSREEIIDSRPIHPGSPNTTSGKYQTSKSTKHNVEGEELCSNLLNHPSFMTGIPPGQELSNRSFWQHNKEAQRSQDLFDDQSSTQDTLEDNKHTSDSLITDESNTSDTMLSYPGTSSQSLNENSNAEEPMLESPHKKLKQDVSQRPFQLNARFNQNEAFCKLLEMGGETDRYRFVQDLFSFMESRQMSISSLPTVSKQAIDLFKLFCIVTKFGGMAEVTKEKKWRDVSGILNMGPSSSAGFVLKKNYGKYLFPYECHHEQGNVDSLPALPAYLDQPNKKSVRPEISNSDNPDCQNSPKMLENIASIKNFQSPGPHMPQSVMPSGSGLSSSSYDHPASYTPDNSTFPSQAPRCTKYPASFNCSTYDHLQMICPPSSPSVKIEKRVIGSHIQKELLFPSNSVESTRPKCIKRKRLGFKQIGQVDAWHVFMSLKSGLICETAWALNVLTGLLGDDVTSSFFCLRSMPGLIEILLDHLRASLVALFGKTFKDLELDWTMRGEHLDLDGSTKELSDNNNFEGHKQCEKLILTDGKEKFKDEIKLDHNLNEERWLNDKKSWDCEGFGEFESSAFDWHLGRGDCSKHILINAESFVNKDFVFQKYFARNSSFKSKEKGYLRNEESTKVDVNNKAETLESTSSDCKEFTIKKESSEDSENPICNHKICGDVRDCHPKLCLQHPYLKSRNDWYGAESRDDKSNFNLLPETFYEQERKCLQVSNIFRSLSFIPGNDSTMSKHSGLLVTLARLMLLEHEHQPRKEDKPQISARSEFKIKKLDNLLLERESQEEFHCPNRTIEMLREDALVILANISGQLDLSFHANEVCSPILDGILHWTTCFTTAANDCNTFSSLGHIEPGNIVPSFAMLALETSSKLCVLDSNIDLIMATLPFSRIVTLIYRLSEFLSIGAVSDQQEEDSPSWMSDQIAREFSLNILSSFVQTYPSCAHLMAVDQNLIGTLLNFIEVQCTKIQVTTSSQTNPTYGNCSPDMLKRAVVVLHRILQIQSKCELERRSLQRHKQRLLDLLCHKLPKSNFLSAMVGDILSFATF